MHDGGPLPGEGQVVAKSANERDAWEQPLCQSQHLAAEPSGEAVEITEWTDVLCVAAHRAAGGAVI